MTREYSLRQVCVILSCSPSWVNKVQHLFGKDLGVKGKVVSFSKKELDGLLKIKVMGMIGIGPKEIKEKRLMYYNNSLVVNKVKKQIKYLIKFLRSEGIEDD